MHHFNQNTIANWDRFYKSNLIQSITGFKPACLIGTISETGQPNLAIFSSIVHLGSNPALIGYINRPLSAAPHTLANIQSTQVYTINHIKASFVNKAHQTSAKYEAHINEFTATGLTMQYMPGITTPFVAESAIQYALQLVEVVPIQHNHTFLVIGKITDIFLKEIEPDADGLISIDKAGSLACLGSDTYCCGNIIQRFQYAKPDRPVTSIL
ncbi:flavin reductase family protein [Hydrotalea flava]|uniref:flavin reductase family protein n=1 Tax=Hydrotalea flava TaxID=714549 RepID=UPI00082E55C8|nr:flavin reductase [Hydrotalea flava]